MGRCNCVNCCRARAERPKEVKWAVDYVVNEVVDTNDECTLRVEFVDRANAISFLNEVRNSDFMHSTMKKPLKVTRYKAK